MVYALASGLGLLQVVDNPARQLFALQLVGPEHLTNAITLNTVNMNLARVIGPAVGAGVISTIGLSECFVVNAGSFVVVIGTNGSLLNERRARALKEAGAAGVPGHRRWASRRVPPVKGRGCDSPDEPAPSTTISSPLVLSPRAPEQASPCCNAGNAFCRVSIRTWSAT